MRLDVPDCRRLGTYTVWSSIVYAMDTPHGAVLGNSTNTYVSRVTGRAATAATAAAKPA